MSGMENVQLLDFIAWMADKRVDFKGSVAMILPES